ncbi:HK97 gp10 family phage protein [Corynebacterium sp. TAE3-ERU16]|uniref:HK97 gp10 family phage protein n=1 Tax=Corynebacterium sp. TAE3-ERU16 TaxID=2849493 RepID=UPI001C47C4FD|nr:HK97 gp10 family phage protein [Corynebacterium sp. TAE3-ERU16]
MTELRLNMDRARAAVTAATERGVNQAAHLLQSYAVMKTPIDEGTLRGSSNVTLMQGAAGATAVVYYSLIYAARQHEETTWRHPRGGQAKYLEEPATDATVQREMLQTIANQIKGTL